MLCFQVAAAQNLSVNADLSACGGEPICKWDFDDGKTAQKCKTVNHTFDSAGTYNVSLKIECGAYSQKVFRTINIEAEGPLESCQAHLNAGHTESGTYKIDPDGRGGASSFRVYCDMEESKGWTRLRLKDRRYGNTRGFSSDPIASTGNRRSLPTGGIDELKPCSYSERLHDVTWVAEDGKLTKDQVNALADRTSTSRQGEWSGYDCQRDGHDCLFNACANGEVVMKQPPASAEVGRESNWSPVQKIRADGPFTNFYYDANADNGGSNIALSKFWYFR